MRGPAPELVGHASSSAEFEAGVQRIARWRQEGLAPESIGVFARTGRRIDDFARALDAAGHPWRRLSDRQAPGSGGIHLGTMHRAKGLEFKAVLVLDCGEAALPNSYALRGLDDPQDHEAAVERERRLLYVAMTRARDELSVTWSGAPSRFLAPLLGRAEEGTT